MALTLKKCAAAPLLPPDRLLQTCTAIKLYSMQRQLMILILVLAVGLQGSLAAFATASSLISADCQITAISHSSGPQDSCCAKSQHAMNCCLDQCLANVSVTVSPAGLIWYSRAAPALPVLPSSFSSRGDSPQVRPPIL
jgi:hypothetical protein